MALTEEALRTYLQDELGIDTAELPMDAPLFSSGLIDSFSLVSLLAHIEQTCGFKIGSSDVNLDNFDSMARVHAYVEAMTGSGH